MRKSEGHAVILGANGQLGRALRRELPDATALRSDDLDIGDANTVEKFDWSQFEMMFNDATYTAVDRAEIDRAPAWRVNALGPAHLARGIARHDTGLVYVSTPTALLDAEPSTYHLTNNGEPVGWAGLAREVPIHVGSSAADVRDVSAAEYFADKPGARPPDLRTASSTPAGPPGQD